MAKKNTIITNWPKFLLQWGSLILLGVLIAFFKMDPEKYCPMGGLEALATYLVRGSLPCSMTTVQIVMGIALAAAVILFSKLFCAFICPIGTVEDLLTKLREAVGIPGIDIRQGSIVDKILRVVKYGLLFWIFYMTATASELFCKNLDPYYAVATGFKGEITLWMSIVTVTLVVLGGFLIKRFWCRYICPLGAASNTLKFWLWLAVLAAAWWLLSVCGLQLNWLYLLGAVCVLGYLLEILCGKPKAQVLHVVRHDERCGKHCHSCMKACPYNIDAPIFDGKVTAVDCTLCGECIAACPTKALSVAVSSNAKPNYFGKFIPAVLCVALIVAGILIGKSWELPTISETWGITEGMKLESVKVENLKSVKCYGSSMTFKAKLERIPGVHGVKTYVGSHSVVIKFDPSVISEAALLEAIYVPASFRVNRPDPQELSELKVYTLRTEKMYDKMDLNNLGLQFRLSGKRIYGVESEYACPLIVRVTADPSEELDAAWFKSIVEKKTLDMPTANGGIKSTPCGFKFVRMEDETGTISVDEFLHKTLNAFTAEVNGRYQAKGDSTYVMKRVEYYKGKPQKVIEIASENYEKPLVNRQLPYVSNVLSTHEGFIGLYVRLNKDLQSCLYIRYAAPLTAEKIWEILDAPTWNITYKGGEVKEESAKLSFKDKGTIYNYKAENFEF